MKRDVLSKTCAVFGDKNINTLNRDYLQKYVLN